MIIFIKKHSNMLFDVFLHMILFTNNYYSINKKPGLSCRQAFVFPSCGNSSSIKNDFNCFKNMLLGPSCGHEFPARCTHFYHHKMFLHKHHQHNSFHSLFSLFNFFLFFDKLILVGRILGIYLPNDPG